MHEVGKDVVKVLSVRIFIAGCMFCFRNLRIFNSIAVHFQILLISNFHVFLKKFTLVEC